MNKKILCSESLFLFQLYSPFPIAPLLSLKKKKNLKIPHPITVCSCGLNFMVMGHYAINIPKNLRRSRFSQLDSKIIDNSVFEVLIMVFFS